MVTSIVKNVNDVGKARLFSSLKDHHIKSTNKVAKYVKLCMAHTRPKIVNADKSHVRYVEIKIEREKLCITGSCVKNARPDGYVIQINKKKK